MDLHTIIQNLEALDAELVDIGFTRRIQILVVGGLYMLAHFHNRDNTQDIDAWIFDPAFYEQDYETFKNLIDFVASDRHLSTQWFNDKVADFLAAAGDQRLPPMSPWSENYRFQIITIYFPSADYILALKLMAAREKDMSDIAVLRQSCNIHTKAQAHALIDRYIAQDIQDIYRLEEKLGRVFE